MAATRRQVLAGGSALAAGAALGARRAPRAAGQDSVTINWWHISTQEPGLSAWQRLADEYMAANPNVNIEITVLENDAFKQRLTTVMQSGEPPDIFQSWGGGVLYEYAAAGLVRDLTDDLAQDGWGASFGQAGLNLYANDGRNYGMPWSLGMVGFWYNKDLFAQAGIETPPETWDEFLADVQLLKDAGITPITVGESEKWPGHFYWVYLAIRMGGKAAFDAAYGRTGSFADPPFVEAGEKLKQLIDLEPFQTDFLGQTYPDARVLMANGQAAMELMGQWSPGVLESDAEDVEALQAYLDFFPFPVVEGGAGDPSDVLGGGDGFAIGVNAPQEAVDFVRFLTSLETQTELTAEGVTVPPVIQGAETAIANPLIQEVAGYLAAANYFQLYYDQFLPPAVGAAVNDAVQGLFAGTLSPEEVAQAIEDSAAAEM
jgi:raffinose/stachyose/melibiose transport system substrate-binding protein